MQINLAFADTPDSKRQSEEVIEDAIATIVSEVMRDLYDPDNAVFRKGQRVLVLIDGQNKKRGTVNFVQRTKAGTATKGQIFYGVACDDGMLIMCNGGCLSIIPPDKPN